jgi:hypothetical protein
LAKVRLNEGDECQQLPYNYVCINSVILPSALLSIERPNIPNDTLPVQSKSAIVSSSELAFKLQPPFEALTRLVNAGVTGLQPPAVPRLHL